MHQWFFAKAGQQHGPITREDLQSKLDSGTLDPDTLVWSEGMPEWKPASSVAGLRTVSSPPSPTPPATSFPHASDSPYAPPAATPLPGVEWNPYTPEGPQVRPWVRYWARTLDLLAFCLIFGIVLTVAFPEFAEMNDTLIGVVLLACYNLYEPILLVIFGTTPFKALLRIRLRNNDGSKLSYWQALRRTLSVWILGQGLGFPLISLITHIYSCSRLTNHGITSWDQAGNFKVSHRPVQWWRWLFVIGFIVGFIALMIIGNHME